MGKRIIQQARGKGSLTYRVRKKAFTKKVGYLKANIQGEAEIVKLEHSAAHSAPIAKVKMGKDFFFTPAFAGSYVEQKISVGKAEPKEGNILFVKDIPQRTSVFNIERHPGDGGKMMRSAGSSAIITKKLENHNVLITMPNKKEITLHPNCRATIGIIAGSGRQLKPFMTAGKKYYKMKARSKLWPRVSAVAVNAIDHPFGSGRGKNVGSKTAKRNAPPGRKVGHLRPRRTGHKR
jgi:large subunit ribosomal protein L2